MTLKSNIGIFDTNGHRLSWEINNSKAAVEVDGRIDHTAYSSIHELVLVLAGPDEENYSNRLYGFRTTGELVFLVNEPKDYWFYYLASHVQHETAVVCISKDHKFDCYYSIDPNDGTLERLNRAY